MQHIFEEIIDKVVIIKKPTKIDPFVASFFRNFAFFVFTLIAGILMVFGKISFFFNINILILAILWPLNSLAYDYFLRNIELSRSQGVFYTFPFIFLFIENVFFHISYSYLQITGIILLVLGAIIFSFDGSLKIPVFNLKSILWMFIKLATYAYFLIVYKMFENEVNEISFYFSTWIIVIAFYLIIIILTRKYKKLRQTAVSENFLKKTFLSKGCDFIASIFYLKALSLTTLTPLSALTSFSPIILLLILLMISHFSNINVAEDFHVNH